MVVNLLPYQILQPWVDAAFKSGASTRRTSAQCGPAGIPLARPQRHLVPNNGGRAGGATGAEGTPKHPGPAVPPGTPCSTHRRRARCHGPDTPLPLRGATVGPFGGPDFPAPLRPAAAIPMGRRRRAS